MTEWNKNNLLNYVIKLNYNVTEKICCYYSYLKILTS